jgi:hypothetical protein
VQTSDEPQTPDRDLQDLIAGWQGAELSDSRKEELLSRLREDRGLRKAVVGEIRMIAMTRTVTAAEPRWLALADELGRDPGYDSQLQLLESTIQQKITMEDAPIVPRWWKPAAIVATAAVALLLIGGAWWWIASLKNRRTVDATATLAVATGLQDCEWELGSDQKPVLNSAVHAGRLDLHRGDLSLAFLSGVTLNLKGPAELDVQSIEKVNCRRGTMRVTVPEAAAGFTVLTPGAAVVDLGSEFVVDVRSTGLTRLTVLAGKARASVIGKDGAVREKIVEESRSVEIDPAKFTIADIESPDNKLPARTASQIPELKLAANYAEIVRASKPAAYWRFEEIAAGVITNEIAGAADLLLNGALSVTAQNGKNHAIDFAPGDTTQFLAARDAWTPPATGFAIELCFASAAFNASTLATFLDTTSGNPFVNLETLAKGTRPGDKPGAFRLLFRNPPSDSGGVALHSQKLYTPKRWHHLVAQHAATKLQLFLDGQPVGETKLDTVADYIPCRLIVGRAKDTAISDTRSFTGLLDEVALYNRSLKPDEIRSHAKAALGQ